MSKINNIINNISQKIVEFSVSIYCAVFILLLSTNSHALKLRKHNCRLRLVLLYLEGQMHPKH